MITLLLMACSHIDSDAEAELAYLGLDTAVSRALELGLLGFNTASSANIDDQQDEGDVSGEMVVSGQVDQGSSDNKGLRLFVALDGYADFLDLDGHDGVHFVYDTDAPLDFDVQLRDIPDGTLEGTLVGPVLLRDDLTGSAAYALSLAGPIQSDGAGGVERVPGETVVTGTVTGPQGGVWDVDVVR